MRWLLCFLSLLLMTHAPTICRAHGVEGYVEMAAGASVKANYDDGEPMAYAAVEVMPAGAKLAFQTGRTDRNGYFIFRPDGPGLWQVVINDGMGHRLALEYEVAADPDAAPVAAESTPPPPVHVDGSTRALKIVTGLAVIFGLCGFFYGWQARRRP